MSLLIESALNIRYVKLHFTVSFIKKCLVPVVKTSALRGGIGEMLLRANCIRDRKCECCDFLQECIVHRTLYTRTFEQKPEYVTSGESIGYVIECENYQEEMNAGEEMQFNLILFGRTIVYLSQYLAAISALGQSGLGKYAARFQITRITNTRNQDLLAGNNIYMANYKVELLKEYVEKRKQKVLDHMRDAGQTTNIIEFKTATSLKYHGEFLKEFQMEAIVLAAQRRLYMMNCFENRADEAFQRIQFPIPLLLEQEQYPISVRRYSNRQDSAMFLRGIKGYVETEQLSEDTLELLLAAEVLHIGKNTHFGFGRVHVR